MHMDDCKGPSIKDGLDTTFPDSTPFDRKLGQQIESRFGKNTSSNDHLNLIPDKKTTPPGMS